MGLETAKGKARELDTNGRRCIQIRRSAGILKNTDLTRYRSRISYTHLESPALVVLAFEQKIMGHILVGR